MIWIGTNFSHPSKIEKNQIIGVLARITTALYPAEACLVIDLFAAHASEVKNMITIEK